MQKPSQTKIEKLTSVGRRFKSPFFLWLTQILKAVAMGVVAACGTFLARWAQPSHSPLHAKGDPIFRILRDGPQILEF
jgi:hypothetical protein